MNKIYDTIIIGAGISGLAAGQYLNDNSEKDFLILESFNKTGGRVQTINFCGKIFPTGPGWIHGKTGNPIFDILDSLNISTEKSNSFSENSIFVWDTNQGREITDIFLEKQRHFKELMEDLSENLNNEKLSSEKSLEQIVSENSSFFEDLTDIDKTVIYTSVEIYNGAPLRQISGQSYMTCDNIYDKEEGELNFRILDPLGVPKLIDYLCHDFENKISFNCNVKTIEWSQDSDPVRITSSDGQQFLCKNVIITLQSGLLAQESITFKPQLPKEKLRALKHVPAVNYCRLFAKFPQKFWPNKEWLIPVIKNVDPVNELLLWQNCSSQNLCDEDDNILICHYTSGCENGSSRFDVEREKLIEMVGESMKNMFPLTYCKPTEVLFVSHWNSGRFAGSFSIAAPGIDEFMIEELQKNIGPLHFAGESVDIDLIGTMQAAYTSGKNAAQKILQKETGFHQD